jgi:hypothetical protein
MCRKLGESADSARHVENGLTCQNIATTKTRENVEDLSKCSFSSVDLELEILDQPANF